MGKQARKQRAAERAARRQSKQKLDFDTFIKNENDHAKMEAKKSELMDYRVAIQLTSEGPLHVFTIKEKDESKVLPFVCSQYDLKNLEEAAYAEVHKLTKPGVVQVIYGDLNAEWPRTKTLWHPGFRVCGHSGRMLSVNGSEDKDPVAKSIRQRKIAAAVAEARQESKPATTTTAIIEYHHGERFVRLRPMRVKVA